MNIKTVIELFDKNENNAYHDEDKVRWLNELDWKIKLNIIDRHESAVKVIVPDYSSADKMQTELLVQEPFCEIYFKWLKCKVFENNGEVDLYNAAVNAFNSAFYEYSSWYHRTHMPLQRFSFRNYKGV